VLKSISASTPAVAGQSARRTPSSRRARRSPATAYVRGRNFELRVRKDLAASGWLVVRSPMSRGPFDLIACRRSTVLLLQCKGGGSIPPAAWNALFDLAERHGFVPVFVTRLGRVVAYYRLVARKGKRGARQPMVKIMMGEHCNAREHKQGDVTATGG